MERSRRKRLSELYGEPVSQLRTPDTLRRRIMENNIKLNKLTGSGDLGNRLDDLADHAPAYPHTHTHGKRKSQQKQPLIPDSVLDLSFQRAVAVTLFAIIQGYKLYDLIILKTNAPISISIGLFSNKFNFLVKYVFFDTAFLYFLPSFKIPSLSFKQPIVYLQIILLIVFNVFLATERTVPFVSILLSIWKTFNAKDVTILGTSTKLEKYNPKKHFKGSHTIKILPENTAYLNPFGDSFCLIEGVTKYQVDVPIRFNSTSDIDFIQLRYTDLETNTPTLLNFTKKSIKKFSHKNINNYYSRDSINGPNINYLNIPITKPGFYEITQVLDSKHLGLRNYRSQLFVPYCPTAYINDVENLKNEKCLNDFDKIKFTISGVPPLTLKYKKLINNNIQTFHDQSLQPEFFESPLLGNSNFLTKDQIGDLNWLSKKSVEVELSNPIKQIGDHSYKIEEIIDGLGNMVNFTSTLKDDDSLFKKYNLMHTFKSYDLPKVELQEKVDTNAKTKKAIVFNVEKLDSNYGPFEATFKFTGENEGVSKTFKYTFQNSGDYFPIETPGTYTLESVKSRHCPGIINGRSVISASMPVVPQLNISSSSITDPCVGQVGSDFDLTFIGTPPFTFQALIYYTDKTGEKVIRENKHIVSQGTRYNFKYDPKVEGDYEIVFTSLKDSLYQEPIELSPKSKFSFKTTMRVKPNAEISQVSTRKSLCLGSEGVVPVHFKGEPPYTLQYEIIETLTSKRTPYKVDGIDSDNYKLITPTFNIGGDYIVSLTSVQDKSGCLVKLSGSDAKLTVRREVPSIAFTPLDEINEVRIKDGEIARLPVRLIGEGSFVVEYDYYDQQGVLMQSFKKTLMNNHKAELDVDKAGTYVLKSGKDSYCEGKVDPSANVFKVSYFDKPYLRINQHSKVSAIDEFTFKKNNICQHHKDSIDLTLYGSPPFIVEYTSVDPNGHRSTESLSTSSKYASILFKNDKSGQYKYFVNGIYDSIYSKEDLNKIQYSPKQVKIEQFVDSSPNGIFKHKRKSYRTCSLNLHDESLLESIILNLEGNSPYSITFEIFHESSSKSDFVTLNKVESKGDLKALYKGLKLGNHIITIVKITDSNGCIQENFPEDNYISISITDFPKITQLESNVNYCEGDHVGYQLIGTPPFSIVYEFNGMKLKTVEHSSQFVRLASDAGVISIDSLKDSSSNCVVDFNKPENAEEGKKLAITVHPIPSVEVSQGDSLVQDIHEGDQAEVIFSFEGTPPFQLTYIRIEDVEVKGKTRSHIVETHTVKDIYAYEYRVVTSLQGTYEAIEVSDAYCVARNE